MGLEAAVTLFPRDPHHRLVGKHLAAFLDRVAERLVALGDGARARLRAGPFDAEVETVSDLLDTLEAARRRSKGREDLEIRFHGEPREALAKFLGVRHVELKFCAFVQPHLLLDAQLCGTCRRPFDWNGFTQVRQAPCGWTRCSEIETVPDELRTCWWLRFHGAGPDGIGERFVEEARRFEGSPFFQSLEGVSRTALHEWHTWG